MMKGLVWPFVIVVIVTSLLLLMMDAISTPTTPSVLNSFINPFKGNIQEQKNEPDIYEIRLLCWVPISPKSHESKSKAIRETWGKRCDELLFMSEIEEPQEGTVILNIKEGRGNTWAKTRMAFKYLYDNYLNDYDWFLKADDDTYVIIENLRYMLTTYDPDLSIAFGARFARKGNKNYFSGGAGYILSRGALKDYAEKAYPNSGLCKSKLSGLGEDVQMGRCMVNSGITLGDSRDELGKGRFFQHQIQDYIKGNYEGWYPGMIKYKVGKGIDCLSNTAVSFHKLKDVSNLYAIEFYIYRLQVYGLERVFTAKVPAPLPPDIEAIPQQVLERFGHPLLDNPDSFEDDATAVKN